ncbi:MAG: hypothetical protein AAF403_01185, partial [Pseudomonadota bacterium]
HGSVAEFQIGSTATVMGFLADDGVSFGKTLNDITPFWRLEVEQTPLAKKLNLDNDKLNSLRALNP